MSGPENVPGAATTPDPRTFHVEQDVIDATSTWALRPALLRELYTGAPDLCVDLRRVNFIDSAGLGMLVEVLKEARQLGGDMRLAHANRSVRRILQVTGLEALFDLGTPEPEHAVGSEQ